MQNADSFAVYENVQGEKHRLMLWLARNRLPKSCAFPGIGLSTAERQAPFVHALIEVNSSAFKIFFLSVLTEGEVQRLSYGSPN